jgi:hypothetical protein
MNFQTQIERDLFDALSPAKKAEVEEHFAALESEDPDLDEEAAELMVRPMSMLEPYDYKLDR